MTDFDPFIDWVEDFAETLTEEELEEIPGWEKLPADIKGQAREAVTGIERSVPEKIVDAISGLGTRIRRFFGLG